MDFLLEGGLEVVWLRGILKDHTAEMHREKRQGGRQKVGNPHLHLVPHNTPEGGV